MINKDCVFCQLSESEGVIFKDKKCYAVLDLNELTKGHTLIISKNHYENMLDTPDKVMAHMYVVAKKIAIRIKHLLKADGINIVASCGTAAKQDIMHFHIHVIPRYSNHSDVIRFYYNDKKLKNTKEKNKRVLMLKKELGSI